MADTGTTGDRKRRSVIESDFLTDHGQLEWLNNHNQQPNGDLIELLETIHKTLFHDIFLVPVTTAAGKEDNCRRNEALEDIATILLSRGALPPQFEAYALDPQDLPWMPKNTRTLLPKLFKS